MIIKNTRSWKKQTQSVFCGEILQDEINDLCSQKLWDCYKNKEKMIKKRTKKQKIKHYKIGTLPNKDNVPMKLEISGKF